jgi:hypothetical protein
MIVTFARDGKEIARHAEAEVNGLLANGHLLATDHYWHEGMVAWGLVGERSWSAATPGAATTPPITPRLTAPGRPALRIRTRPTRTKSPALVLLAILVWSTAGYLYWTRPESAGLAIPPPATAAPR